MLKIFRNIGEIDFSSILNIYAEAIERKANNSDKRAAEQGQYDDLSLFLSDMDTALCLWEHEGRCVSCVRVERYFTGSLLTCLETAPKDRRKGHAFSLVTAVLALLKEEKRLPVYVHVHKSNQVSLNLHKHLGFSYVLDYAHLVDGTISNRYCTMRFE